MTYYEDLTQYIYLKGSFEPQTQNVGWLDKDEPFPSGTVPAEFSARLIEFCRGTANLTRGIHYCNLCNDPDIAIQQARVKRLGSAEIRVFYKGKIYAAPDLIYHYVVDHRYLPPAEFVEAVLNGPVPKTAEYDRLISTLDVDYFYYPDKLR